MSRDEFALIARYLAPLARGSGALGLTDDAAILVPPPGRDLVVSTDAIVEGVHFLAGEAPDGLARRLLAVGFSDVAAMAADPLACTLVTALPRTWSGDEVETWFAGFSAGLGAGMTALGVELLGGDTVATAGALTLALTVFGSVAPGTAVTRAGARPGDLVCVSGTIGDAALGLAVLQQRLPGLAAGDADHLVRRFRQPEARCPLGAALSGVATAAADVSDGLIADLGHICEASGVSARIRADRVPLSDAAAAALATGLVAWPDLVSGGDDYELVFAVPAGWRRKLDALAFRGGVAVTAIGEFELARESPPRPPVRVVDADGRVLDIGSGGYRHF